MHKFAIIVGFMGLAVALGVSHIFDSSANRQQSSTLRANSEDTSLGEVLAQTSIERAIRIHNSSTSPIVIQRFQTSCNCASVRPEQLLIKGNETEVITISIDLPHIHDFPEDCTELPINVSLRPIAEWDGKLRALTPIEIRGTAKLPFQLRPRLLEIGANNQNDRGREDFATSSVAIMEFMGIQDVRVECATHCGRIAIRNEKDGTKHIDFFSDPEQQMMEKESYATLYVKPINCPELSPVRIPIVRTLPDMIEFEPSSLTLRRIERSTDTVGRVRVRSLDGIAIDDLKPLSDSTELVVVAKPEGRNLTDWIIEVKSSTVNDLFVDEIAIEAHISGNVQTCTLVVIGQ